MTLFFVRGVAAAAELTPDMQTLLILRLLAYDHNLRSRAGTAVVIAILYKPGDSDSESNRDGLSKSLQNTAKTYSVLGLPVRQVLVPYATPDALEAKLVEAHAVAVYLCSGLDDAVSAIAAVTRHRSALSLSAVESFVRGGIGVGLLARAKPILVNLPVVQAEGAHFDPAFLNLVETMR